MNAYSRIEVNLLPPEMQPGPMVRYSLLINVALVLLTLAFILINLFLGWIRLDLAREDVEQLQAQVKANAYIENDYNRLAEMGNKLSNYGRLVAYASLDYVDMPVVLNRLSAIIPDGVYLARVSNGSTQNNNSTSMVIQLKASHDDPALLIAALRNFKADSLFSECYLPTAAYGEQDLSAMLDQAGITWAVDGPDVTTNIVSGQYDFEIHARLPRPLPGLSLPTQVDHLPYFSSLGLESNTLDSATGQPPEDVTIEEVQ
jgi:hypothetical protein